MVEDALRVPAGVKAQTGLTVSTSRGQILDGFLPFKSGPREEKLNACCFLLKMDAERQVRGASLLLWVTLGWSRPRAKAVLVLIRSNRYAVQLAPWLIPAPAFPVQVRRWVPRPGLLLTELIWTLNHSFRSVPGWKHLQVHLNRSPDLPPAGSSDGSPVPPQVRETLTLQRIHKITFLIMQLWEKVGFCAL